LNRKIVRLPAEYIPEIDELPGDLARIAAAIDEALPGRGVELTLIIAQVFPGQPLYIRNIEYLIRRRRDDAIRDRYDQGGVTMLALACEYQLSLARIKQILAVPGEKEEEGKQLKLFA
jgi:Mor family transcriptional regulator